jgi:hypothetical protein
MQQVLDALDSDNPDIQLRTAVALRERMSQPEPLFSTPDVTPEVTPYVIDCPRCGHCCPQPNQAPVGWFGYDTGVRAWFETNKGDDDSIPLYKAPRQWVGLTKEEAKEISLANRPYVIDMIAALEARLKEKNT